MAGEVLNMKILYINKHRCKLKDLCFKNRHKSYTQRCPAKEKNPMKKYPFIFQAIVVMTILITVSCTNLQDGKLAEESITARAIKTHDSILASDAFMGRMPFTEGEKKTISYLKNEFQKLGLQPGNNGSYFQEVPMVEIKGRPAGDLKVHAAGGDFTLKFLDEYTASTRRIKEKVTVDHSPLVFVGYGIVAPEYNWNDYKNIDVKGKTVIMLVNDPGYTL